MKARAFLFKPPWKKFLQKQIFLIHFAVPISLQLKKLLNKPVRKIFSLSELVMRTHFIWVSIGKYVENGTVKVPISAKIGVRVQGSTSKIWN